MPTKRKKNHGDGKVEAQDDSPNQDEGSAAEPVYLVAEQEGEQGAYSVFKIHAAGNKRLRVHSVCPLPGTALRISFDTVRSKHGSWIVGVGGGLRAGTVIFEPSTSKTYSGPGFLYPLNDPVVISHGDEVYALSRRPRVVPIFDFEPWFYSLSFKKGVPLGGCGGPTYWVRQQPPPFFPTQLNPYQFRDPPKILVTSYAALGSYILLSAEQEAPIKVDNLGTYAFHVVNKTWDKVHTKNLPFVGQARPIGGSLFVACPVKNGVTTASASLFHMSITDSSSTSATSLSIQEFPVMASEGRIPKPLICSLGTGTFCSIMQRSIHPAASKVVLTTFEVQNIDAILTACESEGVDAKDVLPLVEVKKQRYTYKSKGPSPVLDSMYTVALLSIDRANIEGCDGETAETSGSQTTDGTVMEVPVIPYRAQNGLQN